MTGDLHAAAPDFLPFFITAPGETDVLRNVVIVFLIVTLLVVGNLYLRLHALPERIAHRTNKVQFQVVAVLALLALFTHNSLFWIAALLLALVRIPDFSGPLSSMALSLERIARSPAARPTAPHADAETEAGERGEATAEQAARASWRRQAVMADERAPQPLASSNGPEAAGRREV